MTVRFTVLASGSGGNVSLLEANGFGLVVDAGLGPRQIATRLRTIGRAWCDVHAVLLTHTHSDHWTEATLAHVARHRIPLYCHPTHARRLRESSAAFADLQAARLVRAYREGSEFAPGPGLRCRPLALDHDDRPTFGFRIDGDGNLFNRRWSLAYVADSGTWDDELVAACADVDLLALEFNHDVAMQRSSGRPQSLIARVLGDDGHLSNEQAAEFLRELLLRSRPGRPRDLVQLHLSRDCNRPAAAVRAARSVLDKLRSDTAVHTAQQDRPTPSFTLGTPREPARQRASTAAAQS